MIRDSYCYGCGFRLKEFTIDDADNEGGATLRHSCGAIYQIDASADVGHEYITGGITMSYTLLKRIPVEIMP